MMKAFFRLRLGGFAGPFLLGVVVLVFCPDLPALDRGNRWQADLWWNSPADVRFRGGYTDTWGRIGASVIFREDGLKDHNFYFANSFSAAGSLVPRGLVKELVIPDLTRNLRTRNREKDGFLTDTSYGGSPRKGFALFLPGGSGAGPGVFGYSRDSGELAFGGWGGFRGRHFSFGAAALTSFPEIREIPDTWVLEKVTASGRPLFGGAVQGDFSAGSLNLGVILGGGLTRLDPPGGWFKGYLTWKPKDFLFHAQWGVSSPRAWKPDGSRITEALAWRTEAAWRPGRHFSLSLEMAESQGHLPLYPGAYRTFTSRIAGEAGVVFRPWSCRLALSRDLRGDRDGELTGAYRAAGRLRWERRNFRISLETDAFWAGKDGDRREYGLDWRLAGKIWTLRGDLVIAEGSAGWKRKALLETGVAWKNIRLILQGGLNRELAKASWLSPEDFGKNWLCLPGTGSSGKTELLDFRITLRWRF